MRAGIRAALAAVSLLAMAGCTVVPGGDKPPTVSDRPVAPAPAPSPAQPTTATPAGGRAVDLKLRPGPDVASLGISREQATAALGAFRRSCPGLVKRTDASGLTSGADWIAACDAAKGWPDANAAQFFQTHFESVIVGDGNAFATGYYEPEIMGSRTPQPGYAVPVFRRPPDLIDVDLGQFVDNLKGKRLRGRVQGDRLVPYYERAEIERALSGKGLEIAWAADPVELFFLHIQGSGRLRLPDGSVLRIGYDGQNGREYVGIGGLLRDRGVLAPGQASMQGLMQYLRSQPDGGRAIMNENKSYIFFRELTGDGPIGAMGVAVTPLATVAADPAYVPLGAPVVLKLDRAEANRLWIAQDTGGAIKGSNRFDTFWGAGEDARKIAGGMSGRGEAWLLLPRGTLGRLIGSGRNGANAGS